ncbi:GCK domain [Arabidopsis suecica]|uniref:GCK domain n=1 Tax=Arabidopsis suecica TaxID=45249 RepID=A0A8T1ZV99_ARASU|nr:GCK domain [Arabidopsis suecica]
MSSMNPNAEKSGNDPSAYQGGDSSAASQDPNKSKTVSTSDDNLNETNKEKEEEDCDECWLSRFLKKGGCKDAFIEVDHCWEVKDDGTNCRDARLKLNTCMYSNVDYYGQYLAMQKERFTQSLKDLEEGEKAAAAAKKKEEGETKGK